MSQQLQAVLINVEQAHALLKDNVEQRKKTFPKLAQAGQFILPDYRLTRKREAFKIRKHTFLKKQARSYVAFDSDNGQTLWMHNFSSLSEACFWLNTGLKPTDTDTFESYSSWKVTHHDEIEALKDQLREAHKKTSKKAAKKPEGNKSPVKQAAQKPVKKKKKVHK
ncbi:hypothetical protein [Levilactobacillus bambusae]|uniref:Uncharacterized protein n=1 Tax=Levilactobacillus bambusae TaxID=2024736 RepID=A0A2V1MYN6_9LACO|nr:hypothetical protein [Levilactobacillus bambusae]PWG00124.1 hypothetical protein DCM90_04095 [Levilactobacillus bambusae]